MFDPIIKAVKAVDNFLTDCEEYVEQRVWSGKFIYDLQFISDTSIDSAKKNYHKTSATIQASYIYITLVAFLQKLAGLLMQIQVIADVVSLIADTLRLCIKYFAHYLLIIITALASASFLLTIFKNNPILFSFLLIPILYGNHLLMSAFFLVAGKKDDAIHMTRWEAISQLRPTLRANTFLFLLQISILVILEVFFIGFSFFLSYLIGTMDINWTSSFFFWLPVVMLGILLLVILYISEIILSFSYAFVIQEKKTAVQAIHQSLHSIQTDSRNSIFFYILLTIFSIIFISYVSNNHYEGGFVVGALLMSHAFLFLGFLLRRKYFDKNETVTEPIINKLYRYFKPAVGLGVFSYISMAALIVQAHPTIITFLEAQRPSAESAYGFTTYRNNEAGYTIGYPKLWSVYRWNDTSITIHTNDTGTETGEIKVNIIVQPIEKSNYLSLYEANPGLITYDTDTKNITTKIANLVINEKNAVKYTYTSQTESSLTEFQTHYLIHNNANVYDIAFITKSKRIETEYKGMFEKILKSFQFLPQ